MTLQLDRLSRGPHLPTLVASSISREIAQGRLRSGDRLPAEQMLATTFGVSRNVVREAIARLRSEGLVWSQQGRGAFVSDAPIATVLKIEPDIEADDRAPADAYAGLFQLRNMLEVPAAGLAARLREPHDLLRMRIALDGMADAPYGSVAWLDGDLGFHRAIAEATGNPYVGQIVGFTAERVRESILAAGNQRHTCDMAQATLDEHERILDAIHNADARAAERAMRAHLGGAALRVGLKPFNRKAGPGT